MVSMKDIAAACGVSAATVSKALNAQPDVSEETRERICRTAAEMGYYMNSAARALKTNRTSNLGVLFTDEGSRGLTHEFFAAVLDSFRVEAASHGYDITFIGRPGRGGQIPSYLQHCLFRGVDGVLIACENFYDPQVLEVVESSIPVVTLDHVFNNRSCVLSDNVGGEEALVNYAWRLGHRKIAAIFGNATAVTAQRTIGFHRACEQLGLAIPAEYLLKGVYYDPESCRLNTAKLLALPDPPTCILCPDDFALYGALRAARDAGLRVPEDVSLIGYDGIIVSRVMTPTIATFRQDAAGLGTAAARKLVELIEHPKTAIPEQIVIPGRLLPGESVRNLNGAKTVSFV